MRTFLRTGDDRLVSVDGKPVSDHGADLVQVYLEVSGRVRGTQTSRHLGIVRSAHAHLLAVRTVCVPATVRLAHVSSRWVMSATLLSVGTVRVRAPSPLPYGSRRALRQALRPPGPPRR